MGLSYKETVSIFGKEKADSMFDNAGVSKGRQKMSEEEKHNNEYIKMTESAHAKIIHKYLDDIGIKHNHSPNEAGQSGSKNIIIMMARKKAEGTSSGYPDLHILIPYNNDEGCINLFIELKKAPGKQGGWNGSSFNIEQAGWLNELNRIPFTWVGLCQGSEQAMNLVDEMIKELKNKTLDEVFQIWKDRSFVLYQGQK